MSELLSFFLSFPAVQMGIFASSPSFRMSLPFLRIVMETDRWVEVVFCTVVVVVVVIVLVTISLSR